MLFYEKIGTFRILFRFITKKPAFYWRRGMVLYLLCSTIPTFLTKMKTICKKLDYGHVQSIENVKRNSYLNGQDFINKMQYKFFFQEAAGLFGIDFVQIFKLFIFSEVVGPRYEFFELAIRYASEHPREDHVFYLNSQLSDKYREHLKDFGRVRITRNYDKIIFILSVILSPLLLWGYWKKGGQEKETVFNNNIICNSVKIPVHEIYKELFGAYPQTRYVMIPPYLDRHPKGEVEKFGIIPMRLGKAGYKYLRKDVFRYIYVCLKSFSEIVVYGNEMLRLFYDVIVGRAEAPHGQGNVFVTYEHMYTSRAVRNEILRVEGNKSVFFSKINYSPPKHYITETGYNYDFVCSPSKHLEDAYSLRMAAKKVFLRTGGYDVHKRIIKTNDYVDRISKLKAFKGDSVAITILSCGLVDMSCNIEKKLMTLAKKLAKQSGVKVFIRLKVRYKMPYYDKFYSPFVQNEPSILLTAQEYELTDFLAVTDLFITDISGSGWEMALGGGQTMYVDFFNAADYFLFWEKIDGVVVPEEKAFDEIIKWVRDDEEGLARAKRRETMVRLREYMGYTFSDFETYKENLLSQLSYHLPLFARKK